MLGARPVEGRFRRLRWVANAILIAILFAVPWIRVGGEPLVLLDVPARRFHVFGLVIFPQELYFLWLILAALALSLFLFTALFGRLWCGWACPQTVFMEQVFRRIEYAIEGDWKQQQALDKAPWTAGKAGRKVLKHALFFGISFLIGNTFLAYLIGQNLMTAGRGWLESGKIAPGLGLWWLIVPVMAIAIWLYFSDGRLGRPKPAAEGATP